MQEKLDDRKAESHGISHMNPGHLALANPTLYSARDSGKANTQVTEPPINTDPDQESSGSLMLQTSSLQPLHRRLWCSQHFLYSTQLSKGHLLGPHSHAHSPPCHLFPSCQHNTHHLIRDSGPDFQVLISTRFHLSLHFLMSSGSFSSFFSIFSSFLMMVLCTKKQSYHT